MNLLWLVTAFGGGGGGAVAPPANNDDWLHPIVDTSGTYSTDDGPDIGPEPADLSSWPLEPQ